MSAPPYMKLYWGDYHRGTRHLRSAKEHGAYMLLIGALWDAGGKLPYDEATIASRALCTPKEWAAIGPRILAFFKVKRGHLTHKRVSEELAKYEATIGKRSAAGKISGRARRGKDSGNSGTSVQHMPPYTEPESRLEGINPSKSTRRERSEARPEGASGLRVIEGGEAEAWRKALAEAEHDLPHFERTDPDFASEIAEFIAVAHEKHLAMQVAA